MFAHASLKEGSSPGVDYRKGGNGQGTRTDRPLPFHGSKLYKAFISGGPAYCLPGLPDDSGAFPIRFPGGPSGESEEDQWKKWIERQRNIIDFTLSSLLRRKGKNMALLCVYTLVVFMLASVVFFTHSIKREASIILKDAPEMVVQRMIAGRHEPIPVSYIDKIKGIRGVSSVKRATLGILLRSDRRCELHVDGSRGFRRVAGDIAIGQGISRTRLAFEGDTLEFRSYDGKIIDLEVRKIFSSESELVSSDLVLISEDDFRRLFGASGSTQPI